MLLSDVKVLWLLNVMEVLVWDWVPLFFSCLIVLQSLCVFVVLLKV